MIESCTLHNYVASALAPNRNISTGDTYWEVPVNFNVISGNGRLILYDTGWKQPAYLNAFNCIHWASGPDQLRGLGFDPNDVDMVVLGHGHWDHGGQVEDYPNATLVIQGEELRYIEFATAYPNPGISDTVCGRRPACGYPPDIVDQYFAKISAGQAMVVEGEDEIAPGIKVLPAFKAHTYGSQLLQVNTARGPLIFGSDAFSVWTNIPLYEAANIQQADTVQQALTYERAINIAGVDNLLSAHDPCSYSEEYPITSNAWMGSPVGYRVAELTLAPGQESRRPAGATAPASQCPHAGPANPAPKP
jgi:glyoxylase-like metal-dependent hydrolase (beta-lactamase superfamily II)